MGGAAGQSKDWRTLNEAVEGAVYNYWSRNDQVLSRLYRLGELGSRPLGLVGFKTQSPKLKNRNVSRRVQRHGDYFQNVPLVPPSS